MPNEDKNLNLNDLEARTMASDQKSIQDRGGAEPKPYVPQGPAPEIGANRADSPPTPPLNPLSNPTPLDSAFHQDDKPNVSATPPSAPISPPPAPPSSSSQPGSKKLFIGIVAAVLLLGVGIAVYFFIFQKPAAVVSNPPANNAAETPEAGQPTLPVYEVPKVSTSSEAGNVPESSATSTPTSTPAESESQPPAGLASHLSLLNKPADVINEVQLSAVNLAELRKALEFSSSVPSLREVIFKNSDERVIPFQDIIGNFSSIFDSNLAQNFEADATYVTYNNDQGTWFGLAVKAKSDTDLNALKESVAAIEKNKEEIKNFYLADPGEPGIWQTGAVSGVAARYLKFSRNGASFNYGWSGDTLIIETSYAGFKQLLSYLK